MIDLSKLSNEELVSGLNDFRESIEYLNDLPEYLQATYKKEINTVVDIINYIHHYELELARRNNNNREND